MSSSFCAEVLMILLDKLFIGKPWCKIADKILATRLVMHVLIETLLASVNRVSL